jgi:acyl carrier protein
VNWDAFVPFGGAAHGTSLSRLAMSQDEARTVLGHVLSLRGLGQVVVSTADLEARVTQWVTEMATRAAGEDEAPAHPRPLGLESSYEAPETSSERLVADVWQQVLGIDRVGVHDNFLDLGGNSLTAIQVLGRLQEQHGARVTIEEFIFLTVRQLAALCDSRLPAAAGAGRVPAEHAR